MRYLSKLVRYSKTLTSAVKRVFQRKPCDSIRSANSSSSLLSLRSKIATDGFELENLSENNPFFTRKFNVSSIRRAMKTNTLKVRKDVYGMYQFMENGEEVGYTSLRINKGLSAPKGVYPKDWYIEDAVPDNSGYYKLKPFLSIDEFAMNDRLGKQVLEKRDKKYGTMAMQHIVKYAYESGCEGRIYVQADQLGGTGFKPGKFYYKVGFSPIPRELQNIKFREIRFYRELEKLVAKGYSEKEAVAELESKGLYCVERNGEDYIPSSGCLYMRDPDKVFGQ